MHPRGGFFFPRAARKALALSGVLLFLLSAPAYPSERETLHGPRVTVVYASEHLRAAEDLVDLYPSVKRELEENLRWTVEFHPTVVLVPESRMFHQTAGHPEVVALALPGRNAILIDFPSLGNHPLTLEATLKHELCHLLLHDKIPRGLLPRWLDEGVAQWVSDGISELRLPRRRSLLDEALLSGRTLPLKALSRGFHGDTHTLLLAYEQSLSVVRFLIGRYGPDTLLSLLQGLSEGVSFEDALFNHYSLTVSSLEDAWQEDLEEKMAWTALLIGHLYEILFFLAAACLTVGFIRHRRKKKAAMDALDVPPSQP